MVTYSTEHQDIPVSNTPAGQAGGSYWASLGVTDPGSLLGASDGLAHDPLLDGGSYFCDRPPVVTDKAQAAHAVPTETARIYPAFAEVVLRQRLSVEARFWGILHLRNNPTGGSSWSPDAAVSIIAGDTGHSQKYIRRVIKRGMGKLWRMQHGKLCTFGQERIAAILGHDGETLEGRGILMPTIALDGVMDLRDGLLSVVLAHSKEKPISYAALKDATGLSAGTVKAHRDRAGIIARKNFGKYASRFNRQDAERIARASNRRAIFYKDKNGEYQVVRQLSNSYKVSGYSSASKGRTTRRNRKFRELASTFGGQVDSSKRVRRYHPTIEAASVAQAESRGIEHWVNLGISSDVDANTQVKFSPRGYHKAAAGYPFAGEILC